MSTGILDPLPKETFVNNCADISLDISGVKINLQPKYLAALNSNSLLQNKIINFPQNHSM